MSLEGLQNYFDAKLPLTLESGQVLRLLLSVFLLVFAGAVLIDVLARPQNGVPELLLHAGLIALTYAVSIAFATAGTLLFANLAQGVRVWHLWAISLAGFVSGFFLLPLEQVFAWLPDPTAVRHANPIGFAQLLPVWLLITHLIVQPLLGNSLKQELRKLRDVNALLATSGIDADRAPSPAIRFAVGRTDFVLPADAIRNIVVDDHYCYIHFVQDGEIGKRHIAMPLRDVMKLLPQRFVRIHRSHVVNLAHVVSIKRTDRNIRVVLGGGNELPVSRHRLHEVLPLLQRYAADNQTRNAG